VNCAVELGDAIAARPRRQRENQQQHHGQHFPARESSASGMARKFHLS
jgi:hypothetical protein